MKIKMTTVVRRASVIASALALMAMAGTSNAEDAAAPAAAAPKTLADRNAPANAHKLAVQWCSACHGPGGRSRNPLFPTLAAQSEEYLVTQLKAFRALSQDDLAATHETYYERWIINITGLRKNYRYEEAPRNEERAWDFMKGVARDLDDPTINELAAFFNKQSAVSGRPADAAMLAKGKKLFDEGDMAKGLLPCQSCHGPDAHGNGPIPRLAGQHRDYVSLQVKAIKSGVRAVDQMQGLIQNLTDDDIEAVSAYVQSLN
jgi:cytochrome c553